MREGVCVAMKFVVVSRDAPGHGLKEGRDAVSFSCTCHTTGLGARRLTLT